ncbi:MAG: hypothetical protein O7A03_06075, partial [Alphaproteobacteria bacterium]|nr:hypothetical protein [Alphaproteobacteria bacterium]
MDQWVLVGITLVVFILAGALMGVIAVIQIGGINRKLWQLRKDVGALTTRLDGQAPAATAASPAPAAAPAARSPIPATPARPAPTRPAPPPPPKRPPRKPLDLEQSLTSKWMVWVGGLALALGGVFLVIYAIGEGYFGPGL